MKIISTATKTKSMSMKEIENTTRVRVYTVHKYIERLPIKPPTTSKRDKQV